VSNPTPNVATADQTVGPAVTLSQEQVRVDTEWAVAGHVRLHRRVVSETRLIEVTVRREELVVETDAAVSAAGVIAGPRPDGESVAAPVLGQAPVVFVLREEVPEVATRTRAYERVTAHVGIAQTTQHLTDTVRTEVAELGIDPIDPMA
jgi:uncharacterized protein (TIGR02271 family)